MTHKDLILQQCEKRGMKLKDLADKMGILPSTLSETMRRGKPSYDLLERMSQALGCLPGDLLPHTESDNGCRNGVLLQPVRTAIIVTDQRAMDFRYRRQTDSQHSL